MKSIKDCCMYVPKNLKQKRLLKTNQTFSKLDLCDGGSFSTAIFNSDIQLSFYPFRVLYPFVALLKATYAKNVHIVLSSRY